MSAVYVAASVAAIHGSHKNYKRSTSDSSDVDRYNCTIPVPTIATSRYIDEEPDVGLVKTIQRQHSHVKTQQTRVISKQ